MRKIFLMAVVVLLVVGSTSCKKTRYCRCITVQNEEVIELGDEFYVIEDGSRCADRSKEFSGWGQVVCTEVSKQEATGEENKWWENLFGINKPK